MDIEAHKSDIEGALHSLTSLSSHEKLLYPSPVTAYCQRLRTSWEDLCQEVGMAYHVIPHHCKISIHIIEGSKFWASVSELHTSVLSSFVCTVCTCICWSIHHGWSLMYCTPLLSLCAPIVLQRGRERMATETLDERAAVLLRLRATTPFKLAPQCSSILNNEVSSRSCTL